ncbi:MAG: glycosyltransferase family 2 protein [Fimbriimonadales bacterium]
MEQRTLSLIVPMYNESPNLDDLVRCSVEALETTGLRWQLILVDDGSTDNTHERLQALSQHEPRIVSVRHEVRLGKTAAYRTGFLQAQGDYWFTIDADLQEDLSALRAMIPLLESEYDMVVAWRRVRRDVLSKRIASRVFNTTLRWAFGSPVHDINCGFKGMKRAVGEALIPWLVRDFHRYLPLIARRMGYRVGEVVVVHRPRLHGSSRYGLERYGRALRDLWALIGAYRTGQPPPK